MPLTVGGTIDLPTASWERTGGTIVFSIHHNYKCVPIPDKLKREGKKRVLESGKCGVVIFIVHIINLFTSHFAPKGFAVGSWDGCFLSF